MRAIPLPVLLAGVLPTVAISAPAHFDVGDTHVIVMRPADSWDPNKTTAEYSLDGVRSKSFGFQYIDSTGAKVVPRSGGLFSAKVATPLSDEVLKIMSANGFGTKGSHVYFVSGPIKLEPSQMTELVRAQNQLYRAVVTQQGDPATLGSRIAANKAGNLFLTAVVARFGMAKFGVDTVNLSQYASLYGDISRLTGGASAALLPVPLPDYDWSKFTEVEVRRVTDNANHIGEIVIGYRAPKTQMGEQSALAQGIAAAGGVGASVQEIEAARAQNYEQRLAIWAECKATPACVPK
jgi:hypothetical protein